MPLSPSYMQIWQENVCHVFRITPSESPTLHITLNLVSALHFGITLFWQLLYLFCFLPVCKECISYPGKISTPPTLPSFGLVPCWADIWFTWPHKHFVFQNLQKILLLCIFAGYLRRVTFQIRHRLCQVFLVNFCSPGFSVWWHLSIPIPC